MSSAFSQLADEQYISLKTFRKTGEGVLTAVWFAQVDDQLYVTTGPESGKIKRIRHTPQIEVAPCTRVGEVTGEFMPVHARILPYTEIDTAFTALEAKYGHTDVWKNSSNEERTNGGRVYLEISRP